MTATKPDLTTVVPGLTYYANFVPQSESRNAKEDRPSLNWMCFFGKGRQTMTTDYSQGIGHLPGYNHGRKSVDDVADEKRACEEGTYGGREGSMFRIGAKKLPPPDAADVMHCLLSDAEAIDFADFESWASEFGYDVDSRKAEATYKACVETGLKLRNMLGDENMSKLRELLADL